MIRINKSDKVISTICLCRRAGRLAIGFDAATQGLSAPKAAGIVLASDVSRKTEKEVLFCAEKYNKEVLHAGFTMDEAKNALGKRAGVFLVCDAGLFGSIKASLMEEKTGADIK